MCATHAQEHGLHGLGRQAGRGQDGSVACVAPALWASSEKPDQRSERKRGERPETRRCPAVGNTAPAAAVVLLGRLRNGGPGACRTVTDRSFQSSIASR